MKTINTIQSRQNISRFLLSAVPHRMLELMVKIGSFLPFWKNSEATPYITISILQFLSKLTSFCGGKCDASILQPAPL